jgi:hypothetical protein
MKKTLFLIMLMLGIVFSAPAQSGGPIDLVVLLDTSASMSSSYRATSDYLIGPFLKEFLRIGDTFHLLSFSSSAKLEISRRVEGVGDVETIIGRILLMYPLDSSSDLEGALSFAGNYASSIPMERRKKVVLVSDGGDNSASVQDMITAVSSRLTGQGAEFQYIKVPVTGRPPSSGRPAAPSAPAAAQERSPVRTPPSGQAPRAQVPADSSAGQTPQAPSGQTRPAQPQTAQPQPARPQPGQAQPSQPQLGQTRPAQPQTGQPQPGQAQPQPGQTQPGQAQPQPGPDEAPEAPSSESSGGSVRQETPPSQTASEGRQTPQTVPSRPKAREESSPQPVRKEASTGESVFGNFPLVMGIGIGALLLLALIIFLAVRNLHGSPNRAVARAASVSSAGRQKRIEEERENQKRGVEMMSAFAANQKKSGTPPLSYPPPKPKPMPRDKPDDQSFGDGPPMLSLFVEDQNTAIGRRNIHALKPGYTFSVGGGKSDFLIFLVPIPPYIAEVHFDGRQCTFIPRKPRYFPDIGSQQVPNCIGKTIRVISDKHYELHIRMERYEDPLKALNKLLHSIAVPGEVK